MSDTAPLRLAIIGRNVSAALLVRELMHFTHIDLKWLQTDKDARSKDDPEWILYPKAEKETLEAEGNRLPPSLVPFEDFYIFSDGHRRIAASDLQRGRMPEAWQKIHPAVRRRCLSVGLWSDLSPALTKTLFSQRIVPNARWTFETPISLKERKSPGAAMMLVHREAFLNSVEDAARGRGVKVLLGERNVLGLQRGSARGGHRLLHNAPFGHTEVDRVIWSSLVENLKEEADKKHLRKIAKPLVGSWKTRGAWVDPALVSALPLFSLWLEPTTSAHFLQTGMVGSRDFRRVFAIPAEFTARADQKIWLQIQELSFVEEMPLLPLGSPGEANRARPDQFLWKLCPYLQNHALEFGELSTSDENLFFSEPAPYWHTFSRGILFWSAGTLEKIPNAAKHVLTQFKNARS